MVRNGPVNADKLVTQRITEAGTFQVETRTDIVLVRNPDDSEYPDVNLQLPNAEEAYKNCRIVYMGGTQVRILAAAGDVFNVSDGSNHVGNVLQINGKGGNADLLPVRIDEDEYGWSVTLGGRSIAVSTV